MRQKKETASGDVPAAALGSIVTEFMGAGTWAACRRVVEENPELLLSEQAGSYLLELAAQAEPAPWARDLRDHRELLARCRREGVAVVFGEETHPGGAIFECRNTVEAVRAFIDAETWVHAKRIVERNDSLLTEDADEVLAQLLEINRDDPDLVEDLEMYREILADCCHDGVEETFADLLEE